MILDNYISIKQKLMISLISGALWIYYRKLECYDSLPRNNMIISIIVMIWIYLYYLDMLFLPIGLLIFYLIPQIKNKKNNK